MVSRQDTVFRCTDAFSLCFLLFHISRSATQTSLLTRTKRVPVNHSIIQWDCCSPQRRACTQNAGVCMWRCSARRWQPDRTRRQGIGMKTNLYQPWPRLCKIIKKKSAADRGRDEMGLSLVHYGGPLAGEHIWIAHAGLNQTAGNRGEKARFRRRL